MSDMPKCWAIIPAAGIGERVGASIPKQYLEIAGKSILEHSINVFCQSDRIAGVVIALNAEDERFDKLNIHAQDFEIHSVIGGHTRAQSVLNALNYLQKFSHVDDFALVHDAARPCLSSDDLNKLIDVCLQDSVGGILAAPMSDTVKLVDKQRVTQTLERQKIWRALTPQMFKLGVLLEAMQKSLEQSQVITDEASAIEYMGLNPCVVEGSVSNIKVTTSEDLSVAELFLKLNTES